MPKQAQGTATKKPELTKLTKKQTEGKKEAESLGWKIRFSNGLDAWEARLEDKHLLHYDDFNKLLDRIKELNANEMTDADVDAETDVDVDAETEVELESAQIELNGIFTKVSINQIYPSDSLPQMRRRHRFSNENLDELAASIKESGLINPITLRPMEWKPVESEFGSWGIGIRLGQPDYLIHWTGHKTEAEAQEKCDTRKFEIVAGERRFLASQRAGLTEIPAVVREMTDAEMLKAQLIENVQREDLNPVDEALWYSEMEDKLNWSEKEISLRVGKSVGYVKNRLLLKKLIPQILDDIEAGFIPVTHALELCKLGEVEQTDIYQHLFDTTWDNKQGHVPDKKKIFALPKVKEKIASYFYLLKGALFDVKSPKLHPAGLVCGDCPERTGAAGSLFEDYDPGNDRCLNTFCFKRKTVNHLNSVFERRAEKLRKDYKLDDDWSPLIVASTYSDAPIQHLAEFFPNQEIARASNSRYTNADFQIVEEKDRANCTGEEYGVYMDWENKQLSDFLKSVSVCRRSSCCERHWKNNSSSSGSSDKKRMNELSPKEQEARRRENGARRQQILDSEVFHAVAKRAFCDVALKFGELNGELFDSLPQSEFHLLLNWMFYNFKKADSGLSGWVINEVFKPVIGKKHFDELSKYTYDHPDYTKVFEAWDQTRKISFWYAMMQAHQVKYFGDDLKPEHFQRLYDICERFEIEWIGYDAEARKSFTPAKYAKETEAFAEEVRKWMTLGDGNGRPKTRPVRPFVYATDQQKEEMKKAAEVASSPETSNKGIQTLRCAVCGWTGETWRKKALTKAGKDYPIECRECGAVAVGPAVETPAPSPKTTAGEIVMIFNSAKTGYLNDKKYVVVNPEIRIDETGLRWVELCNEDDPSDTRRACEHLLQTFHVAKVDTV